ncbi:MAG: hypothetical protein O2887_16765 [Bacteroidetes bacterium]|nr:hypothetical protein [Bacteroidota bacterium]MDA1122114.1 hypothetical protein [Bacteroidota bacterium]
MKFIASIVVLLIVSQVRAQDVSAKLDEAASAYSSDDLENTRFSLQQSLAELDALVGQEILKMLPTELAGNSYDETGDEVTGGSGLTGVFVNRTYAGEIKTVRIELVSDSPMISMLSGFLTNPLFASMADGNRKSIKIDSYKAILQKDETDPMHYEVQVPIDQSLFTIRYDGFEDESEVTSIANQIGIGKIAAMLR